MGLEAAGDVVFDFSGSLELARRLWGLADDLEANGSQRVDAAGTALVTWRGVYANEFVDRANTESSSTTHLVATLRSEAEQWANAWVQARNEQNRILRARAVERERDSRGNLEKLGDWLGGGDDSDAQVAQIPSLTTPRAPYFADTNPEYHP